MQLRLGLHYDSALRFFPVNEHGSYLRSEKTRVYVIKACGQFLFFFFFTIILPYPLAQSLPLHCLICLCLTTYHSIFFILFSPSFVVLMSHAFPVQSTRSVLVLLPLWENKTWQTVFLSLFSGSLSHSLTGTQAFRGCYWNIYCECTSGCIVNEVT